MFVVLLCCFCHAPFFAGALINLPANAGNFFLQVDLQCDLDDGGYDPLAPGPAAEEAAELSRYAGAITESLKKGRLSASPTALGGALDSMLERIKAGGGGAGVKENEAGFAESFFLALPSQIVRARSLGSMCVCLDGTFSIDESSWVLITASVLDSNRRVRAVGHAISQGDLAVFHTDLLKFLRDNGMNFDVVIADQRVSPDHVAAGAPGAHSIIAGWHFAEAVRKYCNPFGAEGKHVRDEIFRITNTTSNRETDEIKSRLTTYLSMLFVFTLHAPFPRRHPHQFAGTCRQFFFCRRPQN